MKKGLLILIAILGAIILIIFGLRFISGEDNWIKDSRGVYVKHGNPSSIPQEVLDQQNLISKAQELFDQKKSSDLNFSNGPCLGTIDDTSIDVVHNPRNSIDDQKENQCSDYLENKTNHFIEFDVNGDIIRVH
jgi:hypothetical protein